MTDTQWERNLGTPLPERRTMIWIEDVKDIEDATPEECEKLGIPYQGRKKEQPAARRKATPFERTKAAVYATGNKWAIENFEATHN